MEGFVHFYELAQAGVKESSHVSRIIRSGGDDFYSIWESGWVKLIAELDKLNMRSSVRVKKVFWSLKTELGENFLPTYSEQGIKNANSFLVKLYERMEKDLDNVQFMSFSDEDLVGEDVHQWGRSPFHFRLEYYHKLCS